MPPSTSQRMRAGPLIVALGCASLGGFLVSHHPLAPAWAIAMFAAFGAAVFLWPPIWLFALTALLPALGFAPWTGWIAFEEFDALVLAVATGGYAALAMRGTGAAAENLRGRGGVRLSRFAFALVTLFALSLAVGVYRGVIAATLPGFGWFDGYDDPLNSLRIAKSFFFAILLLPLLEVETQRSEKHAVALLTCGLAAGLAVVSMAVVWEREAFPGLLNFSTDYRVTALFWEMHVGGAALDGYLALTAPFAVWPLLRRSTPLRLAMTGGLTLIAAYACLTTFSRGVYLALPMSFGLLILLLLRQRRSLSARADAGMLIKGFALALAFAAAGYLVFRAGGYRSLLAVLGVLALMLSIRSGTRQISARGWVVALALGSTAGAIGGVVATAIPKGNYVIFAVAFACCAGLCWRTRRTQDTARPVAAYAAYVWALIAAAIVAWGWGGTKALDDSSIVLLLMLALAIWNSRLATPLWSPDLRTQAIIVGGAALVAIVVAVFSGGAYMSDRFGTSERDFGGRLQHWRDGVGMLNTPADWLIGKGLGRFPSSYYFDLRDRDSPGSYRLGVRRDNRFIALFGPKHPAGFGELLRVSQRVPIVAGGQYSVVLDARAPRNVELHLEICEKHLLYNEGCAIAKVDIRATGEVAQRTIVGLNGKKLSGGPWYAPRPAFFAMAVESPGEQVEIDNVSLIGPDGRELLSNGNFAEEMSHWFFTSDRLHLPWHIKNLALDVLFDQGIIGLLLFALLVCASLARLIAGAARRHPVAPLLAAALAGFILVGAFDSLLDVPRVGFLFYLLVLWGLVLSDGTTDGYKLAIQGV